MGQGLIVDQGLIVIQQAIVLKEPQSEAWDAKLLRQALL